jgi:hypothetical protein
MDIGKVVKTVEVRIEAPVELLDEAEWPEESNPVEEPEREREPVAPGRE